MWRGEYIEGGVGVVGLRDACQGANWRNEPSTFSLQND